MTKSKNRQENLPDWIEDCFNESLCLLSSSTTRLYKLSIVRFLWFLSEEHTGMFPPDIRDITPEMIDTVTKEMCLEYAGYASRRGYDLSFHRTDYYAVQYLFRTLFRRDMVSKNVFESVYIFPEKKRDKETLTHTEAQYVWDCIDKGIFFEGDHKKSAYYQKTQLVYRIGFSALMRSGIKISEMLTADLGGVDLENGFVTVATSREILTKRKLDLFTVGLIAEYLEYRKEVNTCSPALLLSNQNGRMNIRSFQKYLKQVAVHTDFPHKVTTTLLRGTLA